MQVFREMRQGLVEPTILVDPQVVRRPVLGKRLAAIRYLHEYIHGPGLFAGNGPGWRLVFRYIMSQRLLNGGAKSGSRSAPDEAVDGVPPLPACSANST